MKAVYFDAGDLEEDKRIDLIGQSVALGKTVGFIVEDDGRKADRYIQKLKAKFPNVVTHAPMKDPTKGVVTVKVSPPDPAKN